MFLTKELPKGLKKDLTGKRFGRWIVRKYVGKNDSGQSIWDCVSGRLKCS